MDRDIPSILPHDLDDLVGTASAPIVVDVRSPADLSAIDRIIPGAIHRSSGDVQDWWRELPTSSNVVVCDLSGGEFSWNVADKLKQFGTYAGYLVDGFVGWYERGLPTRRVVANTSDKWVTRERPKIDRIACPWLIRQFINPLSEFIYVPADRVQTTAEKTGATPYDIKGVPFGHKGERCSFDAILDIYDIKIPPLDRLATIVRGSDTSRPDLARECDGLSAISHGLSANFSDDHEMLEYGMVIYDALFSWCRSRQAEVNNPTSKDQEVRRG